MIRAFVLTGLSFLAACASLDKTLKQEQARIKLDRELSSIEIKGNPADLTLRLLDEALVQMQFSEDLRKEGTKARYSVTQTPGFKVVIGEKIYPRFREKFLGDGFMWHDQLVDLKIALGSSDIKVEAPAGIFELKNRGGDRFSPFVAKSKIAKNESDDPVKEIDPMLAKARVVFALDADRYRKAVAKVKKQYPDFEWEQ